jgi:hypothetical protein
MSLSFFSRKGRVRTSPLVARTLNTLNILAPILLLTTIGLLIGAGCTKQEPELQQRCAQWAIACFSLAMALRLAWGISIRTLRRNADTHDQ